MQKIIYRVGNLFDHPGRYLLQGCNAKGEMNSGVAKTARELYPKNWEVYRATYEATGLTLGQVVVADCGRFVIYDAITQEEYGYDGEKYVSEDAIRTAIQTCDELLKREQEAPSDLPWWELHTPPTQLPELAMPRIGAGLAGGDWAVISEIIEQNANYFVPVVYVQDANLIPKSN